MQTHRNNFLRVIISVVLLALSAATGRCDLKVGDALPDLASFNLEGKLPDSTKGKVVLLDFWASWCLPCAESFPAMDELLKTYGDRGLVIIAVSVDENQKDMERFLKKHPAPFVIVRDAHQKLVAQANPATMPTSFLIDADGHVRFVHNGFHGKETLKDYQSEIESLLKGKNEK